MTRVRAALRPLAAVVVGAALTLAPASAALAADEVGTAWGGDTVNLAWDGSTYATSTQSFVGVPVAVPGDRAYRRLVVTNDGPTAGILRAWVVDVELDGPGGEASAFFDDLTVDWSAAGASSSASLRTLEEAGRTTVARLRLDAGESTEIVVGYLFPESATSGNQSSDGALSAAFDVLLRIEGDTGDDDGGPGDDDGAGEDDGTPDDGDETGDDDGTPDDGDETGDDDGARGDDDLAQTGVTVDRTIGLAVLLVGGGILLVVLPRRRRREQQ